jgi:phosphotransferase system HPr-like phosphotransfer protein
MAKKFTKTIKAFKETGLYNPETQVITGSKDCEETNILEILELLSRNGQEITISAKVEDTIEDIEE